MNNKLRSQFPILKQEVNGHPLTYFDNAATTQKPQSVIDAITNFYETYNSNVHRGIHTLSATASDKYEEVRTQVQAFLNAKSEKEIIFTSGTTESINLVAQSFGTTNLQEGDEIIVSEMEHHANLVPWQQIAQTTNATLHFVPVTDTGELDLDEYKKLLNDKTAIVAITHISNTLGTVNPVKEITALAHAAGATVLIDGAQATAHTAVDVQDIGCDFYVTSAHKMYGPTGIGILYGKEELLNAMPPYQVGGDMVEHVTRDKAIFQQAPHKFEAGTPHIAGVIGLGAAIEFINTAGIETIQQHEHTLTTHAESTFRDLPGIRRIGTAPNATGIFSLVHESIHPHDIGTLLDQQGIAVRTGQHCTHPLMQRFGITGTSRISLAAYNTTEEIDRCAKALQSIIHQFQS